MSAEVILTVCSANVMFLHPSSMDLMVFAARGAHEPFSIRATVLFLYPRSTRWVMNSLMNGNMSALYVVVARTSFPYLKASSTASAMSHLARSLTATFGHPSDLSLSASISAAFFVPPYTEVYITAMPSVSTAYCDQVS